MMGERIALLRNRVGWSQSQLAKELHKLENRNKLGTWRF